MDVGALTSSAQPKEKSNCDIASNSTQKQALTQDHNSTNQKGILKSFM